MPLTDVHVTVSLVKPMAVAVFGKPLILTTETEAKAIKDYETKEQVEADYTTDSAVYRSAEKLFKQQTSRSPIVSIAAAANAADLPALLGTLYDRDWYFLLTTSTAVADLKALADVIEARGQKKFSARVTAAADYAALKAEEYDHTFLQYTKTPDEYADAAWVGLTGPKPVGSVTWKNQQLVDVTPIEMTSTELLAIHNGGANTFVTMSGDKVTSEGRVVSGEYIDVMIAKDWIAQKTQTNVQRVMTRNDKVPYSAVGVVMLEAAVVEVLQEALANGMIAIDDGKPQYSTDFASIADQSPLDRGKRIYRRGKFRFKLEGAIHQAWIDCEIEL